ncbi:Glu-tRNA(Gln) amidotransferase subunit GatD [Candidatus Bathyarchaeota archaeon]|nr:Glu-tRNA(Gln) amidotransferase subunit GatD [Candidatus Bathyarchaeota archaeon]
MPELTGYKGLALEKLKEASASLGDEIKIIKGEKIYKGILIPRPEYQNSDYIVLKLKSGYNIGVKVDSSVKIEVLGFKVEPKFVKPPSPETKEGLPQVSIISTGGTIASRVDYRTGAVEPALNAEDIYSIVPELSKIAKINTEILYNEFSENFTPIHWENIAKAAAKNIEEGVDGIVICHGTDTMAYTAAALSFALQNLPVPVVLVGSQRSSDRPSSDAAANLIGAVSISAKAPFAEVAIVMHKETSDDKLIVIRGVKARKCHTSARNAFKSINAQPIAEYDLLNEEIKFLNEDFKPRVKSEKLVLKPKFNMKAALIKFYPGMNHEIIDFFVDKGYLGLILEGTGLGHVSRYCYNSIKRAVEAGLFIGMTSQCLWGRINMHVYYTGRDLLNLGVTSLEDMLPETALVKLMWVLAQTSELNEVKTLMLKNISGEFSGKRWIEV